jgi:hypothetical protein
MWFTDQGTIAAVGRITAAGQISEFSTGLARGAEPSAIVAGADGRMWFSDEGTPAAIGRVGLGAPRAVAQRPVVLGSARPGRRLRCAGGRWAMWAGRRPSARLLGFDGYRWRRNARPVHGAKGRDLTLSAADHGARISCQITATYPPPLLVSAVAVSRSVTVR